VVEGLNGCSLGAKRRNGVGALGAVLMGTQYSVKERITGEIVAFGLPWEWTIRREESEDCETDKDSD